MHGLRQVNYEHCKKTFGNCPLNVEEGIGEININQSNLRFNLHVNWVISVIPSKSLHYI